MGPFKSEKKKRSTLKPWPMLNLDAIKNGFQMFLKFLWVKKGANDPYPHRKAHLFQTWHPHLEAAWSPLQLWLVVPVTSQLKNMKESISASSQKDGTTKSMFKTANSNVIDL